jgi:hypothetical protein
MRNIGKDEDISRTYKDLKLGTILEDYFNRKKKRTEHTRAVGTRFESGPRQRLS